MDYLNLQTLPDPILIEEILPQLPIEHLDKLYAINTRFNNICLNERLWQIKINNEYPIHITKKPCNLSWRQYYKYLLIFIRQIPITYMDNASNTTVIENIDLTRKSTIESLSAKIIDLSRQKGYNINKYIIRYSEITPRSHIIISFFTQRDGRIGFPLSIPFENTTDITIIGGY